MTVYTIHFDTWRYVTSDHQRALQLEALGGRLVSEQTTYPEYKVNNLDTRR